MLLPSVLPCENAFRVSRSRTTTRSQAQRNSATSLVPINNHPTLTSAVGLGLSLTHASIQLTPRSERIANSSQALNHLLSLDQTPPPPYALSKSRYPHSLLATPTPSRTPSPKTPSKQLIPQSSSWTTPEESSGGEEMEVDTPRASASGNTYTYTIVTRNNKRKRNASSPPVDVNNSTPRHLHPFTTPDPLGTPTICPPAPKIESSTFHPESDDELLDDPFVTPKRTRMRGPASKRLSSTRRNLGPWTEEEDKQLVGMVLAKMRLSERDWAECANTLGRDGISVGERWRGLVEAGDVGLINEKRKEEKMKRARMQGNGRGQLQPLRRSGRTSKGITRR
ncbi:hypothetical protein TWF694_006448 [Orbilia ellipsospora]|uniref:Myb-like domain-containing protein n=1 Tax=Orbilia ellipsospora TaxID=2528407 RepID=A0AAV9XLS4_9PEZI